MNSYRIKIVFVYDLGRGWRAKSGHCGGELGHPYAEHEQRQILHILVHPYMILTSLNVGLFLWRQKIRKLTSQCMEYSLETAIRPRKWIPYPWAPKWELFYDTLEDFVNPINRAAVHRRFELQIQRLNDSLFSSTKTCPGCKPERLYKCIVHSLPISKDLSREETQCTPVQYLMPAEVDSMHKSSGVLGLKGLHLVWLLLLKVELKFTGSVD